MKTRIMLSVVVSGVLSADMYAATGTRDLPATVVSVERRETLSNFIDSGVSPSDLARQPGKGTRLIVLRPAHSQGLKESEKREQP
jgi:hypothetical protein